MSDQSYTEANLKRNIASKQALKLIEQGREARAVMYPYLHTPYDLELFYELNVE